MPRAWRRILLVDGLIVAEQFTGQSLVERHRTVYAALGEELKTAIHALKIKALSPAEWSRPSP